MADNVIVDNGELTDFTVSADEAASGYVQRFKLAYSADGSDSHVEADADGLKVKLGTALPAGTNAIGKLAANSGVDIGDVDVATVAGDVTVVQPTSSSLKGEMKITDGTDIAPVDPTNGLAVDVKAAAALPTGDNTVGRVKLTDGTKVGTLRTCTDKDVINVAITKADGSQVDTFAGTGGVAATDDEDFTQYTSQGTPAMGVYESTPTTVTDGDIGIVGITTNRELNINVAASDLDVPHDDPDSGSPVKIGSRAVNALPASVSATADRANAISDMHGRILTGQIDANMQVWKYISRTTAQGAMTGVTVWDPTSTYKIAITSIVIGSKETTSARLILWFGANGDTTYDAGTDQLVLAASFTPSSSATPGMVFTPPVPIFCTTADYELHITTDAALSVDVTVYGYEWK